MPARLFKRSIKKFFMIFLMFLFLSTIPLSPHDRQKNTYNILGSCSSVWPTTDLNIAKCEFGKATVDYLGYEISAKGVQPNSKVTAIKELKRFIPGAATAQAWLTNLLKGQKGRGANVKISRNEETKSFRRINSLIACLVHPSSDILFSREVVSQI